MLSPAPSSTSVGRRATSIGAASSREAVQPLHVEGQPMYGCGSRDLGGQRIEPGSVARARLHHRRRRSAAQLVVPLEPLVAEQHADGAAAVAAEGAGRAARQRQATVEALEVDHDAPAADR